MIKQIFLALSLGFPLAAYADENNGDLDYFDFEKASLEEVLNQRTSVASRLEFAAREAPGLVTVITRDELLASGARNMIDALRQVPGLDFAVDVESLLGAGVRGNWAHEGKLLVLVDNQRHNEPFFGTAQLERIFVEQVERIEVIRGPGSAVYGGAAGLGVIKITTRGATSIGKGDAAFSYGFLRGGPAGGSASFSAAGKVAGAALTAQAGWADLARGDRRYKAVDGSSYRMKDNSDQRTRNLNLGLHKGAASFRLIADLHRTEQRDGYSTGTYSVPYERNFDAWFGEAKYDFRLGETLTITPVFNYAYMEPYTGYDETVYPRDKSSRQFKYAVSAVYAASERTRLSGGAEYALDYAVLDPKTPVTWHFKGNDRKLSYENQALFAEGVSEFGLGTLSVGARYDRHQKFDPAFSPRLAWTKVLPKGHFKAVCSRGFRAPGIDNLDSNPDLKPETAWVTEAEAGWAPRDGVYLTAGVFDILVKDPIVFYLDAGNQRYGNYGKTGSRGTELAARFKGSWGHGDFSFSRYHATDNKVPFFASGLPGESLLGFARHKLAFSSSLRLGRGYTAGPSAVLYLDRHGYDSGGIERHFGNTLLANLYLSKTGLLDNRLEAGIGVYDIFASGYAYLQSYNGGHAPLPAPSREVRARLSWKF